MKLNKMSDAHKNIIYDIVINLNRTPIQKERFIMFYGLGPYLGNRHTLSNIAKKYKCTYSSIRCSVEAMNVSLFRMSDDVFQTLIKMLEEYKQ